MTHPAHTLVTWYKSQHRKLPWRESRDPYAIWVSETMLQQTRVETVIPYYHDFMTEFPTIEALAEAAEETVLKRWQGLGYYSRARNLQKAARQVVREYGGRIPNDEAAVRSLPGIGPYTCGAVMSIAFGKPVPAVDGNVLRVMARFLGVHDAVETPAAKRRITDQVAVWLETAPPSELTQGLMELGALVCTPRSPACLMCPLQTDCYAKQAGLMGELPVRQKKKARKVFDVFALWYEVGGMVLMEKRPDSGLLADMWQLPAVEVERESTEPTDVDVVTRLRDAFESLLPSNPTAGAVRERAEAEFTVIGQEKHVFTHLEWYVKVYRPVGLLDSDVSRMDERNRALAPRYAFVPRAELHRLALPRVYEKLLEGIVGG